MNLDLDIHVSGNLETDTLIQDFVKELQNKMQNNIKNAEEGISLENTTFEGNKIITKYRDKMLTERAKILNSYADKTSKQGEMYYIYNKNSKMEDGYNICICAEDKSHVIIEESAENLPEEAKIGCVLRKTENRYTIDNDATKVISEEIYKMKEKILEEQNQYLASKRIEGHVYEVSENAGESVWLFDLTDNSNEGIEEIDFPPELLKNIKEGDLFVYKNGTYQIQT